MQLCNCDIITIEGKNTQIPLHYIALLPLPLLFPLNLIALLPLPLTALSPFLSILLPFCLSYCSPSYLALCCLCVSKEALALSTPLLPTTCLLLTPVYFSISSPSLLLLRTILFFLSFTLFLSSSS